MILADKIIMLRKRNGWSQEELADKLDISRQSVSKWESGSSIPDLDKIIKMSGLFGVSTDYLLKEEIEEIPQGEGLSSDETPESPRRRISLEEAENFLDRTKEFAHMIGLGVALCICSPIVLIVWGGSAELGLTRASSDLAEGIGVMVLLGMVAIAVIIFILQGIHYDKFDWLEREILAPEYGVEGMVSKRKENYVSTFGVCIAVGVGLCILSVIPLCVIGSMGAAGEEMEMWGVGIFLVTVAVAVYLFVRAGIIHDSFDKLLQTDDYSVEKKKMRKESRLSIIAGIYWSLVVAAYLLWSFVTRTWHTTWIIWPVAGVLWAAVAGVVRLITSLLHSSKKE
ncbi:MAG: helix-turn-helix domain-containing protein [Clostridium sp.]|nr:helix-turn-helix domain-containing protein [Acetatifactor muris]MCM1527206.1 helix-turn-helix domain-containing protein [Bacteroides sp.]MCM1562469.1 helix-turn-helix domain-containing protein [Clostridium sp.]